MAHGLAGRSYNGTHWTQTEEGKRKMSRALRKAAKARKKVELDEAVKHLNASKGTGNAETSTHNEAKLVEPKETKIVHKTRARPGAEIPDAEIAETVGHIRLLILLRSQSVGATANAYAFRVLERIALETRR